MSNHSIPALTSGQGSSVEYRPIAGSETHWIGSDGSVWSLHRLKGYFQSGDGSHTIVRVGVKAQDGKTKQYSVGRLVLEAFVGPRPPGMVCCHKNDNPRDNRLENVRWDLPIENVADALRNGKIKSGQSASCAKLSNEDVVAIRALRRRGMSQQQLGDMFGVSRSTISLIELEKTWRAGAARVEEVQ